MGKVLMAVDETVGSTSVLSVYKTMVRDPESVVLIHVQRLEDTSMQTEKIMDFYKQELESVGPVRVTVLVRDGVPSEEILKAAREEAVDLIIMGRSNKSAFQRLVAGCVTKEVERAATVPVLVAKTGGCEKSITYGLRGESYAA